MGITSSLSNPFALLPFSFGLFILVFGYIKLWQLRRSTHPAQIQIFWVWLFGLIALLLGIFGQVQTMMNTYQLIEEAKDINPTMIAGGIRKSFLPSQIGLMVLILSLMAWGILNSIKKKRSML